MKTAEFNTKLLEIKLLEIAVRASGTHTKSSANFVKELGITEIVQKIKDEHPELAKTLMGGSHSSDWIEGYKQACHLVAILGDLTNTMLERFGNEETDDDFGVRDWARELTATARRLVPEIATPRLKLQKGGAAREEKVEA